MSIDWLWAVLDAFAKIIAIVALIDGVRLLAQSGASRKALLTAVFGIFMCTTWASLNYLKYRGVTNTLVFLETTGALKLPPPDEWSPSLSPERKEEIGREVASHEYFRSGTLSNYLDRSGSIQVFTPSQKQVSEREANVAKLAQLQLLANARYGDAIEWILWGVLAALIGFASGKALKRERSGT